MFPFIKVFHSFSLAKRTCVFNNLPPLEAGLFAWKIKNELVKQLAVLRRAPTSLGKILVQFSGITKGEGGGPGGVGRGGGRAIGGGYC